MLTIDRPFRTLTDRMRCRICNRRKSRCCCVTGSSSSSASSSSSGGGSGSAASSGVPSFSGSSTDATDCSYCQWGIARASFTVTPPSRASMLSCDEVNDATPGPGCIEPLTMYYASACRWESVDTCSTTGSSCFTYCGVTYDSSRTTAAVEATSATTANLVIRYRMYPAANCSTTGGTISVSIEFRSTNFNCLTGGSFGYFDVTSSGSPLGRYATPTPCCMDGNAYIADNPSIDVG